MSSNNPWMIEVKSLRREYPIADGVVKALDGVSFRIRKGEICCIFGQSGSGKSTLLNQLAGLEKPTSGGIRINGTIITRLNENQMTRFRAEHMGFVFQSYNLLPSMDALENTAMPLMFLGVDSKTRMKKAAAMLRRVGLKNRMHHYPSQMSGGQQQRCGIARALVNQPDVIFADEPTGNLDSRSSREIMEMIREFSRMYHQTVVLVSHDPEAAKYCDHVITLLDGKIESEKWIESEPESELDAGAAAAVCA